MAEHAVALQCLDRGVACERARERLADALGSAVPDPDSTGILEVRVDADDFEGALSRVWDAMAAAGADDHLAFAEHPDVPEHWRRKDGSGDPPGSLA
jgi:hypothetical protein